MLAIGVHPYIGAALAILTTVHVVAGSPVHSSASSSKCRYLPEDAGWPNHSAWNTLNQTISGKLIRGTPLAQPCHGPAADAAACAQIQDEWTTLTPFLGDPVNVMSPYWMNNSCSPFSGPDGTCTLGNLAPYAINVSSAADAIAGIKFAQAHNIRLTIKNTGHDFLGRSAGEGSLALWTHNMKDITFLNYSSPSYKGPAARIGAGVVNSEIFAAASARGYRAVGGSCPTVGVTGGLSQAGGHGPLGAKYGLGSDQVLEWEVVTSAGEHIVASPNQHRDLYWALSGGGAGNFAVVLSMTAKVHKDGPVAGASFSFANTDDTAFWAAITAWLKHLLVLDTIDGFATLWDFTAAGFALEYATLPDATASDITAALAPFIQEVEALNVTLLTNEANDHANFQQHYQYWASQSYDTNNSVGGRLIPRSAVQLDLPALVATFRDIVVNASNVGGSQISGIANNVTHARVGNAAASNAVLPAWRDSLFTLTIGIPLAEDAPWDRIRNGQAQLNEWQDRLRAVTPGGGTYANEATFDNSNWKWDYYGPNYDSLLAIKTKYDPHFLFWGNAAVGSDAYRKVAADGRLCRVCS